MQKGANKMTTLISKKCWRHSHNGELIQCDTQCQAYDEHTNSCKLIQIPRIKIEKREKLKTY